MATKTADGARTPEAITRSFSEKSSKMNDALSQFIDTIRAAGLEPPESIEPGKLHRFPGVGKSPNNRAGWCLFFDDRMGGCFGDWSSGISDTWQAKRNKAKSLEERTAFAHHVAAAKEQAKAERRARQDNAANRASTIWNAATPAPGDHPYLIRKGIQPHEARLHKGMIVLPVMDFTGKLTSLQFIDPHGAKRLLSGGRKHGCFILVAGDISVASHVIICEGWATGCTLSENEPTSLVLAAIDAGNLEAVALAAHDRWPTLELVIAGDDDRQTPGNPGATMARAAAFASGALLAMPQWPKNAPECLSDFNDLDLWIKGVTHD